jgi:predicted small lipoprotein YifL
MNTLAPFSAPGFILIIALFQAACGVKAPPLPPLPVTAQQAERQEQTSAPSPAPSRRDSEKR